MVDPKSPTPEWESDDNPSSRYDSVLRCLQERLGCSLQNLSDRMPLVSEREEAAHKHSGDESCRFCSEVFLQRKEEPTCPSFDRQSKHCHIYSQNGWNQESSPLLISNTNLEILLTKQVDPDGRTLAGYRNLVVDWES